MSDKEFPMKKWVCVVALAATFVLALAMSAAATAHKYSRGCNSHLCEKRVCKASCRARLARKVQAHAASAISAADQAWLRSTRMCESGGNYATNTGNGFYGAYQFTISSWRAVGGSGLPSAAPPWEQDMRALRLRNLSGTGNWPVCG